MLGFMKETCELLITPIHQGQTNGCGTAALAMALNALNSQGRQFTQAMLDKDYRRFNSFTSPGILAEAARAAGFFAEVCHRMTLAEIRNHLSAGRLILALHSVNGRVSGLHYVLVSGFWTDPQSGETSLVLWDPAPSTNQRKILPYRDFEQRYWQPVRLMGFQGPDRMGIVLSAKDDLPPPSMSLPLPVRVAHGLNRLLNAVSGWGKVFD